MEFQKIELVCTEEGKTTRGSAMRRDLPNSERLARGGKIFGAFFGVALITVFVPILHFVLPPLFLLIGAFLGYNEYSAKGEVQKGEIDCPNCGKHIEIPREGEEWPRIQRCPSCSFTLKIERAT